VQLFKEYKSISCERAVAVKKLLHRLKLCIAQVPQNDTPFWRNVTCGLRLAATAAAVLGILGIPTGLGVGFDLAVGLSLHFLLFALATKAVAVLFSLLCLPIPRVCAAGFTVAAALTYYVFASAQSGILFSFVMAALFSLSGTAAGLLYAFFRAAEIRRSRKAALLLLLLAAASLLLFLPDSSPPALPADNFTGGADAALNPANPGPYRFSYFTYGSGTDKHRPEFGKDVTLISRTVDGSAYIADWPRLRTLFWGFDEKALPLNGRVWLPEGEGPFPLFLIVHGNHTMEEFSDTGYAYLGELLAGRGFITVSVDQNFLNYSSWSGIPDENMKLRAWHLIHHLLQIEEFHQSEGNPFFGKVDWNNVAVAGHSRGGQAAAMAADYQKWFADDSTLARFASFHIKAVAALAPTDSAVDGKKAFLRDIYYLVLHGSQDGDVNSFSGDRQYRRVTFSRGSECFKASLYIVGANHSQFNTAWGRLDSSLPKGLLLNQKQTIPPAAQQEIAKIYLAAFLETVLHGRQEYLPLFRDWRYGGKWLPQARYLSHFTGSDYLPLLVFHSNAGKTDFTGGVTATAEGTSYFEVETVLDRRGNSRGRDGVVLAWEDKACYTVSLPETYCRQHLPGTPAVLSFSLATLGLDRSGDKRGDSTPQIDVEIKAGAAVRLPLDSFLPVPPPVYTQYCKISLLDPYFRNGKYKAATEPIFQSFDLPLDTFARLDSDFNPADISQITLHFSGGPGKIMLDGMGFYCSESR
jgi:hypothetical protein